MNNDTVKDLGEVQLIKIIKELIFEKSGRNLLRDDSSFLNIDESEKALKLVVNSDMLVATTDIPKQMNYYQIGGKSVIMNTSDIIVKGAKPKAIIISLGLPNSLKLMYFKEIISGIIETCKKFDLEYIGGDINQTQELIINPTVIAWENPSKIIFRKGIKIGDFLVANGKFGLTGVGFDILIKKEGDIPKFPNYKESILSVLEPNISEEAYLINKNNLATGSIDSSDGLLKSLTDLMISNPGVGFEVSFNEDLIHEEALRYSKEFNIPLEDLVFNAGEEFIHLFTIDPKHFDVVREIIANQGGTIFKIGQVIGEEKIFILKDGQKKEITTQGFEHFR